MTKYMFHGDDQAATRKALRIQVENEQKAGKEINFLEGTKLLPRDLESALVSSNLFTEESLVIENLFSRPVSSDRKKLFTMIKSYEGPKNLLFWEKKEVSKANISYLAASPKDAKVFVAKAPAVIFKFIDSLSPDNMPKALNLLHETCTQAEEGFIFFMLSRHVADLIIAKSGDSSKLNPWKKGRLIDQASLWSDTSLNTFHSELLSIDRSIKTGLTRNSYLTHLDLLLVSLIR